MKTVVRPGDAGPRINLHAVGISTASLSVALPSRTAMIVPPIRLRGRRSSVMKLEPAAVFAGRD